jgi:hypothetical protein
MNKRLLLLASIFLVLIVSITAYFFCDPSEIKIVEINFVSNCAVCENGDKIPTNIAMFSDVYTDDENDIQYISKLSFKRLDLDRITDTILFSKQINKNSDPDLMMELFKNERNYISATTGMYVNEPKTENKSLDNEIYMVKHYFLVRQGSKKVDNRIYFDSPDLLKRQISEEINSGKLNKNGFKPNSIVIVLDYCINTVENGVDLEDNGQGEDDQISEVGQDKVPDQSQVEENTDAKYFQGNIKQNGNTINWNSDLLSANRLTITFTSIADGKVLVSDDVTGKTNYYFSYSNSIYEGSKIKVSISGSWNNGSKISGSSSLTTTTLECH